MRKKRKKRQSAPAQPTQAQQQTQQQAAQQPRPKRQRPSSMATFAAYGRQGLVDLQNFVANPWGPQQSEAMQGTGGRVTPQEVFLERGNAPGKLAQAEAVWGKQASQQAQQQQPRRNRGRGQEPSP
ncbi:MAG: hypothetical protein U0746_02820 [Gemmataceae bacterium]